MTFCFGSKERVVGFKFTEMLTTEIPQSFGPSPPIKRSFFVVVVVVYGFVSPTPNPRRFVIVCDRNVMEGKVIGTLQVDGVGRPPKVGERWIGNKWMGKNTVTNKSSPQSWQVQHSPPLLASSFLYLRCLLYHLMECEENYILFVLVTKIYLNQIPHGIKRVYANIQHLNHQKHHPRTSGLFVYEYLNLVSEFDTQFFK